jgi:hypothetical protein
MRNSLSKRIALAAQTPRPCVVGTRWQSRMPMPLSERRHKVKTAYGMRARSGMKPAGGRVADRNPLAGSFFFLTILAIGGEFTLF